MGASIEVSVLFKAIDTFLNAAKEDGIIQNYSLEYTNADLPIGHSQTCFIEAFNNFVEKLNELKICHHQEQKESPSNSLSLNEEQKENDLSKPDIDSKFVQIRVDKKGIERLINAFISRKRKEVDEWNVQEFCSHPVIDDEAINYDNYTSCARVDAVFIPRSGSKSHVKVSRVVNQWGPQVNLISPNKLHTVSTNVERKKDIDALPCGIVERLSNMETHLKLKSGAPVQISIYSRLKNLEDRILYLEGMSPDYIFSTKGNISSETQKDKISKKYADWSIEEIDNRIQVLKDKLKHQYQQANNDS